MSRKMKQPTAPVEETTPEEGSPLAAALGAQTPEEAAKLLRPKIPPTVGEITTAEQWRKKSRQEALLRLPTSELVVRVARPRWSALVRQGSLTEADVDPAQAFNQGNPDLNRIRKLLPHIVVSPKVEFSNGTPISDDAMDVDDIPPVDLMMLFTWAFAGGVVDLGAVTIESE